MSGVGDLLKYWHTARHLRPVQIYGRIWRYFYWPQVDGRPAPALRPLGKSIIAFPARRPSLLGPRRFRFLNKEGAVESSGDWNGPAQSRLWVYNLHYFDYLVGQGADQPFEWRRDLINRWIIENPPRQGSGWESYPTSLRIVNWIKWAFSKNSLGEQSLHSLAIQVRWLIKRLEWHLLGNHLFANAKALVFSGIFFDGKEADRWLEKGLAILARELPIQILEDGGQFERSPMYHALAFEDMLDLINITAAYPDAVPERWRAFVSGWPRIAGKMGNWLNAMCHPDGEIGFFNDAAIGIAPAPKELKQYAIRLGIDFGAEISGGITALQPSGYVRLSSGLAVALLDVAPIGPDYLPGHAHADTLSFELSLFAQRLIVNSGTSVYGSDAERLRQRGTSAHNTVAIDGQDSSEIWAGFRVARRANPFALNIREGGGISEVRCAHDGYKRLPGSPVHGRNWELSGQQLAVTDMLAGRYGEAVARYHFHPSVKVEPGAGTAGVLLFAEGHICRWRIKGGEGRVVSGTWHPEFGISIPNFCLEVRFVDSVCRVVFEWG